MLQIVLSWLDPYHRFFLLVIIGFSCFNFYSTKIRNNIVEKLFYISGVSSEHEYISRVKMIVKRNIGLLLEFNQYSSD